MRCSGCHAGDSEEEIALRRLVQEIDATVKGYSCSCEHEIAKHTMRVWGSRRLVQEMDASKCVTVWWPAVLMSRLCQVDTLLTIKGYSCSC